MSDVPTSAPPAFRPRLIDLNADLGEGLPWDAAILPEITSANLGCARHAGTPDDVRRTLEAIARQRDSHQPGATPTLRVGAHPGHPDPDHFGRRVLPITPQGLRDLLLEQTHDLIAWAGEFGLTVAFLKPHGALYHQILDDPDLADTALDVAHLLGLDLVGMPHTPLFERATRRHPALRVVAEGFVDRRLTSQGRLWPRSQPGAILTDPEDIARQIEDLLTRGVETLCVHGDRPEAVELARWTRQVIKRSGWQVGWPTPRQTSDATPIPLPSPKA
jgi:UPF0271 protein